MRDLLQEIWSTLRQNKLRTGLTGFAVAWGVFMLIALLGAGNGLLNALMSNNGNFLTNSMEIYSGSMSKPYKGLKEGTNIYFDSKDVTTTGGPLFSQVIDQVSPMLMHSITMDYNGQQISTTLCGVAPVHSDIEKVAMCKGRFIDKIDMDECRKVIIIDSKTASQLLDDDPDYSKIIGRNINVDKYAFKVVGIYKNDESMYQNDAYSPYPTVHTIYSKNNYMYRMFFTFHGLETEKANKDFQKKYTRAINLNHNASPDDENTVYFWNRFTQNMQMNKAVRIVRMALWIIGLFTLLSGIVGVSNIMLITVKERTHEFGIRKAIGAKPGSILRLIIVESIVITAFFGYIGMLGGLIANQIMDATLGNNPIDLGIAQVNMFLNPTVGIGVAVKATITLIIAGTIAGIFPARKAAKVRPIEALRAE
jgi:putative ABC transport system permease protein